MNTEGKKAVIEWRAHIEIVNSDAVNQCWMTRGHKCVMKDTDTVLHQSECRSL